MLFRKPCWPHGWQNYIPLTEFRLVFLCGPDEWHMSVTPNHVILSSWLNVVTLFYEFCLSCQRNSATQTKQLCNNWEMPFYPTNSDAVISGHSFLKIVRRPQCKQNRHMFVTVFHCVHYGGYKKTPLKSGSIGFPVSSVLIDSSYN